MFRYRENPSAAFVSSAQQCASDFPDPIEKKGFGNSLDIVMIHFTF